MAQDFLAVCRLRRNNEFRQHSCSNRAASSQMNLSSLQAHSGEQVDFTSESNQKDVAEAVPVESSGDQKVSSNILSPLVLLFEVYLRHGSIDF